jgi:hypothetical protein
MIHVTVLHTVAEIKVSGSIEEFSKDLDRVKTDIKPADRSFDEFRKLWVIRNPEAYGHIGYMRNALEARANQPELF